MSFDMGMISVLALLFVVGAISGVSLFVIFRHSRDTHRQSALILKALVKNTENIHSFDKKINSLSSINAQSLQFQQRAFEHQRMLVMSMNQQLKSISGMMGNANKNAVASERSNAAPIQLARSKTNNTFEKRRSLSALQKPVTHNGKGVVRLEDLLRRVEPQEVSADEATEDAVQMPVEVVEQEKRSVANG